MTTSLLTAVSIVALISAQTEAAHRIATDLA